MSPVFRAWAETTNFNQSSQDQVPAEGNGGHLVLVDVLSTRFQQKEKETLLPVCPGESVPGRRLDPNSPC